MFNLNLKAKLKCPQLPKSVFALWVKYIIWSSLWGIYKNTHTNHSKPDSLQEDPGGQRLLEDQEVQEDPETGEIHE